MSCGAVVFDMFHTLVAPEDYRPKSFRRADQVAEILDLPRKAFSSYWTDTRECRVSTDTPPLELVKDFIRQRDIEATHEDLARADDVLGRYQDLAILNPRQSILDALQKIRACQLIVGLLSNADTREIRQWPNSPLASCFDELCFSCEIGFAKPDIKAFQTVLCRLEVDSVERMVFVGDGGGGELQAAREAEFDLVVFFRRFVARNGLRTDRQLHMFEKQAHVTVDSMKELLDLIAQ